MTLVSHQEVTIRLVLDENRPYFPGDSIRGKVMLACPRSVSPHGIRLIWAGGVTIRPSPQDQENYLYFRHNYAVSNEKLDGKKISNGIAYKSSAFVENYDTNIPLLFVMEQSVTYSFAFDVQVPVDVPLPSSTEAETAMLGGKIVYTIECCLDLIMDDPTPARSHTMVTVLEHMDVRLPELAVPRTEEAVYALWLTGSPKTNPYDYRTAMRATLPLQACARGNDLTIVIHVWHSAEFQRPKGVTVSLIRERRLNYHGSDYAFPDETILSMRADVDLRPEKRFVQTLNCTLPIRSDITPSIGATAKLLEISYKVHIKVQLQEGTYQTPAGDTKSFMSVEIPLLIGTVPLMIGKKLVSPRKNTASATRTITDSSRKSDDTKESNSNNNGSVGSTEAKKKLFGRKSSKHETASEKKGGSLLKIFPSFGSSSNKRKQKEDTATVVSSSSHSNHHADNDSVQHHSSISSSKNTDHGNRNSYQNGSQRSVSSPRLEADTLTTQRHVTPSVDNNNNNNQPVKITNSSVELKPDEKGDEIFDYELLAEINKAKAMTAGASSDIIKNSVSPPITNPPTPTTAAHSIQQHRQQSSVKGDDIFDNGVEGRPQSPMSVPTTVSNNDGGVQYHNIFESSDEEDYDLDDNDKEDDHHDPAVQSNGSPDGDNNKLIYFNILEDSDDEGGDGNITDNENTSDANAEVNGSNDVNHLENSQIIKPTENEQLQKDNKESATSSSSTSNYYYQLPSPPPDRRHQHTENLDDDNMNNSDSDDESDSSPLSLLSKKNRKLCQRQQ